MSSARSISPLKEYEINVDLENRVLRRISKTRKDEQRKKQSRENQNREKQIASNEWMFMINQTNKFVEFEKQQCYSSLQSLGKSPEISEFLTKYTNGDLEKSKSIHGFFKKCVEQLGYPEKDVKRAIYLHGSDLNEVIDFIEYGRND